MNNLDLETVRLLVHIADRKPDEAMESAKRLVGFSRDEATTVMLAEIASSRQFGKWARTAAIYALGFLGKRRDAAVLMRVLADVRESPHLRSHAAEALGNIGAHGALSLLKKTILHRDSLIVKKSCM